jgi:hypothetical protein
MATDPSMPALLTMSVKSNHDETRANRVRFSMTHTAAWLDSVFKAGYTGTR